MKIDPHRLPITVFWAMMVLLVPVVMLLPFVGVVAILWWAPPVVGQALLVSVLAVVVAVMEFQ